MTSIKDDVFKLIPEPGEIVMSKVLNNDTCQYLLNINLELDEIYNTDIYSEICNKLSENPFSVNQLLSDQFRNYKNILKSNLSPDSDLLSYIRTFPFLEKKPIMDEFTPKECIDDVNHLGKEPLLSDEKYAKLTSDLQLIGILMILILIPIMVNASDNFLVSILSTVSFIFSWPFIIIAVALLLFPKKLDTAIRRYNPFAKRAWKADHEKWRKDKSQYESKCDELKQSLCENESWNILESKRVDKINAKNLAHYYNKRDMFQIKLDSAYEYLETGLRSENAKAINDYFNMEILRLSFPYSFPREVSLRFEPDRKALLIFFRLPSEENILLVKEFRTYEPILFKQKEQDILYENILCQIALSVISFLFASDKNNNIETIFFQGWLKYLDKSIGKIAETTVMTLQVTKELASSINFDNVDPVECFNSYLKGVCATKTKMIVPVQPIIILDKNDPRFVTGYDVISTIDAKTNLATMEWQDFENLVRDLFEKKYCNGGQEVKITRSSRDKGVDAVLFDPDPIKGGKIIIQAKRYINTVPVSAVRDLYGTVMSEGANRGILVTTAQYGNDSYEFAKNKPLTLLSGNEVLSLLFQIGINASIDLEEARRLKSDV